MLAALPFIHVTEGGEEEDEGKEGRRAFSFWCRLLLFADDAKIFTELTVRATLELS